MNAEQVRELLRAKVNGNQSAWAKSLGISQSYVADVLRGRQPPGDKIIAALGIERVVTYRKTA